MEIGDGLNNNNWFCSNDNYTLERRFIILFSNLALYGFKLKLVERDKVSHPLKIDSKSLIINFNDSPETMNGGWDET